MLGFGKKKEHLFDFQVIGEKKSIIVPREIDVNPEENIDIIETPFPKINNIKVKDNNISKPEPDSEIKEEINLELIQPTVAALNVPKIKKSTLTLKEPQIHTRGQNKNNNFFNKILKSSLVTKLVFEIKKVLKLVETKLAKRGIVLDMNNISYPINESITVIILFLISCILFQQSLLTYHSIDKLPLIKQYFVLKRDIKIEEEKIKENIKAEYLADILKFGVKTEYGRYPENGYLEAFKQIFPERLSDLQLLTFIEGWGSEFIEYDGKKIRVDNNLIRSFDQDSKPIDNGKLKGYKFNIELEGPPNKVKNLLYNIRYSNKVPKNFIEIKKKYNLEKGILSVDMKVIFYFSK